MKFHVLIEKEEETGWFVVKCPALPGCVSQGRTKKEAVANIKEAIIGWLEVEDERALADARKKGIAGKELAIAF